MFERFTEFARRVVVLAQEEARELKHDYIGTEHLLLGLVGEQEGVDVAARVLDSLGITLDGVRAQVVRIVGLGEEAVSGQIPFTPRAKKVLELALREALTRGHNYIGTEHVLLGIVRENEGVAARILHESGADAEKIRDEIVRALSGPGAVQPARRGWPNLPEGRIDIWLDDAARRALELAAAEAFRAGRRAIDATDLIVGLADAGGERGDAGRELAARVLVELGTTADEVRAAAARARGTPRDG